MKRLVLAFSLLFLLPWHVQAEAPPVFFSEVAWAGSNASTSDEWFELCGAPGTDLSGWSIEGAATSGGTLIVPDSSVIPASGVFLIANYSADDSHSTLAVAPNFVTTSVALSNSALFLTLRDAGGNAIDVVGATGTPPPAGSSGGVKTSMERPDAAAETWISASTSSGFDAGAIELGTPGTCLVPITEVIASEPPPAEEVPIEATTSATETPETADETPMETATPSAATSTPEYAATQAPPIEPMSAVRISEIYPSPLSGESEWIELVNPSGIGEVLDGWSIEDGKGTATTLQGTLLPWARIVITSPKGQLNNDGDLVVLKDAHGRVPDGVGYGAWDAGRYPNVGKVGKGEAVMRLELQNVFSVTMTPTPSEANVLTEYETPEETLSPPATTAPVATPIVNTPTQTVSSAPTAMLIPASVKAPTVSASKTVVSPKPATKKAAAKPAASRYKGNAYTGIIVSPPGVYSKTRMYILRNDAVEELRLSKSAAVKFGVGDRISFVAQTKSEESVAYLLANPNSIVRTESASATFATISVWPSVTGAYFLTAEIVSVHGNVLEVRAGDIEGDVLVPSGTTAPLKPGDTISVEGFITPGARPRMVMARPDGIALFKAFRAEAAGLTDARGHLPWTTMTLLTLIAATVGVTVYLRMQRLKRLALTQAPLEDGAWE